MTAHGRCLFPGCDGEIHCRGLCDGHRVQLRRGHQLAPLKRRKLRVLVPHPVIPRALLVPLTGGRFATIDEGDQDLVSPYFWSLKEQPDDSRCVSYAHSRIPRPDGERCTWMLHRFLWSHWHGAEAPLLDHENTDGLDCRRSNLRPATKRENARNKRRRRDNTSGFKGVNFANGKWVARIDADGERRFLGRFDSPQAAGLAYAQAVRSFHGAFGRVA
jgi:hypothetical protein